jgi:hypothetical protein
LRTFEKVGLRKIEHSTRALSQQRISFSEDGTIASHLDQEVTFIASVAASDAASDVGA